MAYVDFSNAKIECIHKGALGKAYFGLDGSGGTMFLNLFNSDGDSITSASTATAEVSLEGFKIIRTGTFTESGTEFYIKVYNMVVGGTDIAWKISNVLFNEGDSYSFEIFFKI
jgi:hypothetical protein